jgi:hypothetical protein
MNKVLVIVIAITLAVTAAQAANIDTAASGNWTTLGTWSGSVVPTTVDQARLRHDVTLSSSVSSISVLRVGRNTQTSVPTLTISSGGSLATMGNAIIADQLSGSLLINGGSLSVGDVLNIGGAASASGSVTVDSGSLSVVNLMRVGQSFNSTFTLNGGTVQARNMSIGTNSTFNLFGGSLTLTMATNAASVLQFSSVGSLLDIRSDAALNVGGNYVSTLDAAIAAGRVDWSLGTSTLGNLYGTGDQSWDDGSGSYLHAYYDSGNNRTIAWADMVAVPEPTTVSLVVLGVGLSFVRRRRMK